MGVHHECGCKALSNTRMRYGWCLSLGKFLKVPCQPTSCSSFSLHACDARNLTALSAFGAGAVLRLRSGPNP